MPVVVSLLRGVNVGGNRKMKMDSLRELYESLGMRGARTYIQSGNVVSHSAKGAGAAESNRIEKAIEQAFGFRPDVVLRTREQLHDIVKATPFATRPELATNKILVHFLKAEPAPQAAQTVSRIPAKEELHLIGRELFVYYPDGAGQSKLSPSALDKALRTPATGRNWNTVLKLLEMADSLYATGV